MTAIKVQMNFPIVSRFRAPDSALFSESFLYFWKERTALEVALQNKFSMSFYEFIPHGSIMGFLLHLVNFCNFYKIIQYV